MLKILTIPNNDLRYQLILVILETDNYLLAWSNTTAGSFLLAVSSVHLTYQD